MARHEAAMARLHEAHPEDPETAIFHARSVIANAPPDDLALESKPFLLRISFILVRVFSVSHRESSIKFGFSY
jgi:hypothetical protein